MKYVLLSLVVVCIVLSLYGLRSKEEKRVPITRGHMAGYTDVYDRYFRSAVFVHWPHRFKKDWVLAKAQGAVESGFNPNAKSPVGAKGIMQIMPGTWKDLQRTLKTDGGILNAQSNIVQGVRYMKTRFEFWVVKREKKCLMELALACYNAGCARILRAQELSGWKKCWVDISPYLPQVTGKKSKETIEYVPKIMTLYEGAR